MFSFSFNNLPELLDSIVKYKKSIFYQKNSGNAGDGLIDYSFQQILPKDIIIQPQIDNANYLIYGGGGNLIPLYEDCRNFILKNKDKQIIICPQTIRGNEDILCFPNIYFFCRDKISFDHVHKFTTNVCLDIDVAMRCKPPIINIIPNGILYCFRNDHEKSLIFIPFENQDISIWGTHDSKSFLLYEVSKYSLIHTNRLHVAIAGWLLKIKTYLYDNSYGKNKAVYDTWDQLKSHITFI